MEQRLYKLPEGWEWAQLGEVLDVRDGTHDSPKYHQSGYPLVTSKNLTSQGLNLGNVKYISEEDFEQIAKRSKVARSDILFAMIGTIGNPIIVKEEPKFAIKNVALFKRRDSTQCMEFFRYFLLSPQVIEQMTADCKGAAQKFVGLGYLRKFYLPLPPLAEQKRIVNKLNALFTRLDTAISHLQDNLKLTNDLFASALGEAFSGKDKYKRIEVKRISKKIQYGYTTKAKETGNAQFLRITDIQKGVVNWEQVPFVSIGKMELEKYSLNTHDIVFARSGATSGKSFLITSPPKNTIFASYLIRIVPDLEAIIPEFLYLYFQSSEYWRQVSENTSGAAQPNINGKKLGAFTIPLPPLKEQKKIVSHLNAFSKRITSLEVATEEKLRDLAALKASLLDNAFRGQL